ncbi:MAG: hypothetical protein JW395_2772 [Nitrospira sp.]|nr:hypothetical protein [Nitrospira sp.]
MPVLLAHQHEVNAPMPMGFEPSQELRVRLVFRAKHSLDFVDQYRGARLDLQQTRLHVLACHPERNLLFQLRHLYPFKQREPIQIEAIDVHIHAPTGPDPLEQPLRDRVVGLS